MLGGIEAGGTKFICVAGERPDEIMQSARIEVTKPAETIGAAISFFRRLEAAGGSLEAIGVGTFGPLELRSGNPRYGSILTTTKPGWSGTDMLAPFVDAFGVPVGIDTDVNAAALGEARYGAGSGPDSFVYLTIGTGIGGGAIIGGQVRHGLPHPEMGHVAVPRRPGDDFPGACPFHRTCLEGMASGPAVAGRFGRRAELLSHAEREAAAELVGFYLAAGIASLVYALAPERFVIGGGLAALPGVVAAARRELPGMLSGYPGLPEQAADEFVVAAALGGAAGPTGSLVLAEEAALRG